MGQVEDAVQFHVDDGDVQVAEGVCTAEANTTAGSTRLAALSGVDVESQDE